MTAECTLHSSLLLKAQRFRIADALPLALFDAWRGVTKGHKTVWIPGTFAQPEICLYALGWALHHIGAIPNFILRARLAKSASVLNFRLAALRSGIPASALPALGTLPLADAAAIPQASSPADSSLLPQTRLSPPRVLMESR